MRKTKEAKALDERITALYPRACQGLHVSILKLPAIVAAGKAVGVAGGNDEAICAALRQACIDAGGVATTA